MDKMRKFAFGLVCLAAFSFTAGSARAAADWSIGPVTSWTASLSNLLYTATISSSGFAKLADGKLEQLPLGNGVGNNATLTWTLPRAATVYAVNVFTKFADAGCDGIDVAKLEVKRSGSDDWIDLGAPEVEYATKHLDGGNISHDGHRGSFYAIYKDTDQVPLATDVVGFRIKFGPNQDNNASYYGEIELVGYTDAGVLLSLTQPAPLLGSVTISPSSPDGYYAPGTVVTLSVVKTNGVEFVKWFGDVPDADVTTEPLAITMDRSRYISTRLLAPYFVANGSNITDGWQQYRVSESSGSITISGVVDLGEGKSADLTKPIVGGKTITKIGSNAFANSGLASLVLPGTVTVIENQAFGSCSIVSLVLPSSLERLEHRAFVNCTRLTSVSPMFPDSLVYYGGGCFADAGAFTGDVRIGFGVDGTGAPKAVTFGIHDTTRGIQFQSQPLGPNIELGPGVTSIPAYTFRNCRNVTNLVLGANMATIAANAFENFGQRAASVSFEGDKPTMAEAAFTIVSGGVASRVRFLTPWHGGLRYPAWTAFLTDTAKVTPWENLSAEDQAAYATNFPDQMEKHKTYGKVVSSEGGLPVGSWVCVRKPAGIVLVVR